MKKDKKFYSFIEKQMKDKNILDMFIYGSLCYETNNETSDIDILCIVEKTKEDKEIETIKDKDFSIDFHYISKLEWIKEIKNCSEFVYEIVSVINTRYMLKYNWNFQELILYDKQLIRKSFSSKASNSFVKAKKKMTVEVEKGINIEKNIYIGQKSLWHSLKILTFGIELIKTGTIELNNDELKKMYQDILKIKNWDILKEKYKPIYNNLHSQFKILTNKEGD